MAKCIGAVENTNNGEVKVDILDGIDNQEGAELIAQHFASIANEYAPLDASLLPAFLPAPKPPQVTEYSVYKRIEKLKNTRSTLGIDLPNKVRQAFSVELATPVTHLINSCLMQQVYPNLWKEELVTPVPIFCTPKSLRILGRYPPQVIFQKYLRDI